MLPFSLLYKRTCYIPSDASSRADDQQRPDMLWYVEAKKAYEPENCVHEGGRQEELGVVEERKGWNRNISCALSKSSDGETRAYHYSLESR